jgi:hypothetical protein
MKKIVAVAAVLLVLGTVPSVSAHESCWTTADRPVTSSSSVMFPGHRQCEEIHQVYSLVVNAWRRTPGGSWVFLGSANWSGPPGTGLHRGLVISGYNCAKEYKTTASGSNSNHTANSDTSPIRLPTC